MKHTYIKSFFAFSVAVALFATTGCKKLEDFGDTDTRNDRANDPSTAYLLTNAESQVANILSSTAGGIRGSLYAQQWSETQYTDVSLYGNPQLDFGGYSGPLYDLQRIIDLNTNAATKGALNVTGTATASFGSNGSQIAIATILKVYYLWTTTDRWGDIPYSEALKGAGNLTPSYDKQQDIYAQMLADLKAANASFDPTIAAVKGDIFYAGSIATQVAKWTKLSNSLRMLIALRMSKVYPNAGGLAATEFADAYAGGGIVTNADNMVATYVGGSALNTNVFYSVLNGRKDYAFSKTLGDILTNMGDVRRAAYGSSGPAFPYGLKRDDAVAFDGSVSGGYALPINLTYRAVTSPVVILPASYVLLAEAEAAERGWIAASAQTLYEAGVTASFTQWGQSAAAAATYLAGSSANFTTGSGGGTDIGLLAAFPSVVGADAVTNTNLERIQLQRYLASFGDGLQAWSEWRRTGIPHLTPTVFGVNTPREIPRRLTYGTNEYGLNPASVAEAAARYTGGDKMSSRMWWDQ
ncbi:SusD/RagB family nutrient-binding outer membrane lipoprotein [soil metagenome]